MVYTFIHLLQEDSNDFDPYAVENRPKRPRRNPGASGKLPEADYLARPTLIKECHVLDKFDNSWWSGVVTKVSKNKDQYQVTVKWDSRGEETVYKSEVVNYNEDANFGAVPAVGSNAERNRMPASHSASKL